MITTQSKRFLKDYFNALEARIPEEDVDDADKIGDMLYDMMDVQYGYGYESLALQLFTSKDWDGGEDSWSIAEQRFNKLNEHEKTLLIRRVHELLYVLAVSELAAFSHRGGWFPCLPAIIREDGDWGMTVERYQACDDKIINGYPNYPEYILRTLKEFGFTDKVLLALPCLFPVQCICGKRATVFNDDHPPVCEKDFTRWYQKEPTKRKGL